MAETMERGLATEREHLARIISDLIEEHAHCDTRWPATARIAQDKALVFADAILSRLPAADGSQNDIRWAVNVLLEKIACKFEENSTFDLWRSDAAALVRSHKHKDAAPASQSTERDRALEEAAQVAENLLLAVIPDQCSTRDSLKFQREKIAERIRAMKTSAAAHTRSNAADMEE